MTPRSMAAIQATIATTLNPSPDRKEAVGKNTKWNGKLSEPPPAPLKFPSLAKCSERPMSEEVVRPTSAAISTREHHGSGKS
jgi:hypothetical protein